MRKIDKNALEKAFRIPEPTQKDAFLRSIGAMAQEEKSVPGWMSWQRLAGIGVSAIACIVLWGMYAHLQEEKLQIVSDVAMQTTASSDERHDKAENQEDVCLTTPLSTGTSHSTTKDEISITLSGSTVLTGIKVPSETAENVFSAETESINFPETLPEQTMQTTQTTISSGVQTSISSTTAMPQITTQTTVTSASSGTMTTIRPQTTTITRVTIWHEVTTTKPKTTIWYQTTTTKPKTTIMYEPVMTTTCAWESPPLEKVDYTVVPPCRYDVTDKIYFLDEAPSDDITIPTLNELAAHAETIATGMIVECIYTSIDGTPYTQLNVVLDETYSADYETGSIISVYLEGGYMPLADYIAQNDAGDAFAEMTSEEIAETTVFCKGNKRFVPNVGDSYLFFLNEGDAAFPYGAHVPAVFADGALYKQSGEEFYTIAANTRAFTHDELTACLSEILR